MPLLTLDEFRGLTPTALEDAALQLLLDAAEQEIVRAAGPAGSTVELFGGGTHAIVLSRAIDTITSITETFGTFGSSVTTLDTSDYVVDPGGFIIYRQSGGTHSRSRWWGRVTVTYTPADDDALRKSVQHDLIKLELNYSPGLTMEQVGAWMQQQSVDRALDRDRDAILGRLSIGPSLVIVGG